MNWQHLRTFVWLRWRLLANQWRRGGAFNAILMTLVAGSALALAIPLGITCFFVGINVFPKATPESLLYAWDAIVFAFIFFWSIGLMTELQRTETLSLSKFLHLPVSVKEAFLINYLSSLVSLSLVVFVPVLIGLGLALVYTKGVMLLLVVPLTAAFFLMVTALTYQFQGWLASLMSNPRRRRTVMVGAMLIFMVIFQLPNLLSFSFQGDIQQRADRAVELSQKQTELNRALTASEINLDEYNRRQKEIRESDQLAQDLQRRQKSQYRERAIKLANLALPPGWLPLGVMTAVQGNPIPAILGSLGLSLIGGASLWRSYRTTLRLYQGQFTSRKPKAIRAAATPKWQNNLGPTLLERHLPGLSEPASVIALGGFKSLLRSPEGKMMLITPLIVCVIFGTSVMRWPNGFPQGARPLMGIGIIGFTMMGMMQLMANQFGFDRDGFRVFVLFAARRRDILLGKNLAFAPVTAGLTAILLTVLQFVVPMRFEHFLSMIPQFISMYLLFCIMANVISIYAPMQIAAGSLKPAGAKIGPVLLQMAMFFFLFPLLQLPTLLPFATEWAIESQGWTERIPICLLLTLLECAAVILIYRYCLNWQGDLLQDREQKILETVTNRPS